jgi:hypothetical protein
MIHFLQPAKAGLNAEGVKLLANVYSEIQVTPRAVADNGVDEGKRGNLINRSENDLSAIPHSKGRNLTTEFTHPEIQEPFKTPILSRVGKQRKAVHRNLKPRSLAARLSMGNDGVKNAFMTTREEADGTQNFENKASRSERFGSKGEGDRVQRIGVVQDRRIAVLASEGKFRKKKKN